MLRTLIALFAIGSVSVLAFGQKTSEWTTYLGGRFNDEPYAIAVGRDGAVHLVGTTRSPDFPTTNGAVRTAPPRTSQSGQGPSGQIRPEQYVGFLARLNAQGEQLTYGTYVGGSVRDSVNSIAVDSEGAMYIGGMTDSPDFPVTANASQSTFGGNDPRRGNTPGDGFVARLNRTGAMEFATFLGGSSSDVVAAVAVNGDGYIYATGSTTSTDFATEPPPSGSPDGFVVKIDTCSGRIVWSLRLVGVGGTAPTGIAVTETGEVVVSGTRESSANSEGRDGFAVAISTQGQLIRDLTFGGSGDETVAGPAIGKDGSIYVAGATSSIDLKTSQSGYQRNYQGGQFDGYAVKLGADSNTSFATYLGSEVYERVTGMAVDGTGRVHVAGDVTGVSSLQITIGAPAQPRGASSELFYAVVGAAGTEVEYLSRHGGRSVAPGIFRVTRESKIALGPDGDAYVVAMTTDDIVSSRGAYQRDRAGGHELVVFRFSGATMKP